MFCKNFKRAAMTSSGSNFLQVRIIITKCLIEIKFIKTFQNLFSFRLSDMWDYPASIFWKSYKASLFSIFFIFKLVR